MIKIAHIFLEIALFIICNNKKGWIRGTAITLKNKENEIKTKKAK